MLMTKSRSSSELSSKLLLMVTPALLNSRWMAPWACSISAGSAAMRARSATLATWVVILLRRPCRIARVCCKPFSEISTSASAQPSLASATARARPMPLPAPVITATLLFRSFMLVLPSNRICYFFGTGVADAKTGAMDSLGVFNRRDTFVAVDAATFVMLGAGCLFGQERITQQSASQLDEIKSFRHQPFKAGVGAGPAHIDHVALYFLANAFGLFQEIQFLVGVVLEQRRPDDVHDGFHQRIFFRPDQRFVNVATAKHDHRVHGAGAAAGDDAVDAAFVQQHGNVHGVVIIQAAAHAFGQADFADHGKGIAHGVAHRSEHPQWQPHAIGE